MSVRVFYSSALFLIVFFSFAGNSVFAEEVNHGPTTLPMESVSSLVCMVTVPEEFDKTILINFTSKEKQNMMARLDKQNGYVSSQEVDAGTYGVDFINIVGENASDYTINAPEQVVIKAADAGTFNMSITLKPTAKKTEIETEAAAESVISVPRSHKDSNGSIPETNEDDAVRSNATASGANQDIVRAADIQKQPSKVLLNESTITTIITFSILVLLVLLIFIFIYSTFAPKTSASDRAGSRLVVD